MHAFQDPQVLPVASDDSAGLARSSASLQQKGAAFFRCLSWHCGCLGRYVVVHPPVACLKAHRPRKLRQFGDVRK